MDETLEQRGFRTTCQVSVNFRGHSHEERARGQNVGFYPILSGYPKGLLLPTSAGFMNPCIPKFQGKVLL